MEDGTCGVCKWYCEVIEGQGKCHRYPPTVYSRPGEIYDQTHPTVDESDLCGEFIPTEPEDKDGK